MVLNLMLAKKILALLFTGTLYLSAHAQIDTSVVNKGKVVLADAKEKLKTRKEMMASKVVSILNKKKNQLQASFSPLNKLKTDPLFAIDSTILQSSLTYGQGIYGNPAWISGNSLLMSTTLKGIPLNTELIYNNYPDYGDLRTLSNGFRYNVSFDYQRYARQWQEKLNEFLKTMEPEEFLDTAIIRYKNNLVTQQSDFKQQLTDFVKEKSKHTELYETLAKGDSLNIRLLENQLESSVLNSYYTDLKAKTSAAADSSTNEFQKAAREKLTIIDSIKTLVSKYKENEQKLKEVYSYANTIKDEIQNTFKDMNSLDSKEIMNLLGGGGLQKLLMKVSGLQMGNVPINESIAGLSGLNLKGAGLNFKGKNSFGGFQAGTIPEPFTGVNDIGNTLVPILPDSLRKKPAQLWSFEYGIGDPDKEFIKTTLTGIKKPENNGEPNKSFLLGVDGRTKLFRDTWLEVGFAKNIAKKRVVSTTDESDKTTPGIFENLSFKASLEGFYEKAGLNFRAAYENQPAAFVILPGINSRSGRRRIFLNIRQKLFDEKMQVSFRFDRKNFLNGIYQNSDSYSTLIKGEVRYRFKMGQYVSLYYSPATSSYSSALKDSLLAQRMRGNATGINYNIRKRVRGVTFSTNGNVEYYSNRYIATGYNASDTTLNDFPFKTLSYQLSLDIITMVDFSWFMRVFQQVNLTKEGGQDVTWIGSNNSSTLEGGFNYTFKESLIASAGLRFNQLKAYNQQWGLTYSLTYNKAKWGLWLSGNQKIATKHNQNNQFGFGNRYETGFRHSF